MPGETAVVTINGLPYVARLPISHFQVQQQTEAFRTTGSFLRTNNPKLEPYAVNDWSGGFGTKFIRPGHPEDLRGFFDATVTTMWKRGITLPITSTDMTEPVSGGRLEASANFGGQLVGAFVDADDDAVRHWNVARKTNDAGTGWTSLGTIVGEAYGEDDSKTRTYDIMAAGDRMYAICGINNDHLLRYSTGNLSGTSAWTAPATTAPPLNLWNSAAEMIADDHGARLAWDGVRAVLALHDAVGGEIEVRISSDGGDTWTNPAGGAIAFKSGGGPTGMVAYLDTDSTTVIYIGSEEGLWLVDLAGGSASLQVAMPIAANNCRRMAVHNGSLYAPVDNGDNSAFGMKKITVRDGMFLVEDVGLDISQGIPTDMLGYVRWMTTAGPFLIATVGGANANRVPRIISITGIEGEGWQNVRSNITADEAYSWIGTRGNNLYFQEGGHTSTTAGDTHVIENQLAPPKAGVTHNFDTPRDLELPEFGGDAPEEAGAFFQVQADAEDLADGDEVLDFEYGLNGSDPTTAGPTIDDTNRKQGLGTSKRGLSARTIRQNIEFNRGSTTTKTPSLREWVILFRKKAEELHGYEFDIDALETERLFHRGQDQIRDELRALRRTATLFEFIESDSEGAVQVEIPTFNDLDFITTGAGSQAKSQVGGLIQVRLEEMLEH